MYHSITIGEKNTWDDWHLMPKIPPLFNPPPARTRLVSIFGATGTIDLTKAAAGRTLYDNRRGYWEFYAENGFLPWEELFEEILTYLQNRSMRAILEDDPGYYYEGSFSLNAWRSDPHYSVITIDYNVLPYKYELTGTADDWLWDSFNFETGVIREYGNIEVNGETVVSLIGSRAPAIPLITADTSGMTITFGGTEYTLNAGENMIDDIIVEPGENPMTISGSGRVTIDYRGGSL